MNNEVNAWIEKLGAMSSEDIRAFLKVEGVTGLKADSRSCPLAHFLQAQTGRDVQVGFCGIYDDVTIWEVPESMKQFIRQFDEGEYAELVAHR